MHRMTTCRKRLQLAEKLSKQFAGIGIDLSCTMHH